MLKGLWVGCFLGAIISTFLGGCRSGVKLDPSLSQDERERVRVDLQALGRLSIDPHQSQWFGPVFSKPEVQASASKKSLPTQLENYLNDRIQYVLPETMIVEGRFRIPLMPEERLSATSGFVVAHNVGTSLFYQLRMQGEFEALFSVDQKQLILRSPRVGLVQLGPGFTEDRTPAGTPIDSLFRMGVLIHEARHSDCPSGLSEQALKESIDRKPVSDKSCGHLHAVCPPGHIYQGRSSCDAHPWGAYAIEAIFLQGLAEGCRSCTASQKATAKLLALDRLSRLDPVMAEKMFAGKLGLPNMAGSPEELPSRGKP